MKAILRTKDGIETIVDDYEEDSGEYIKKCTPYSESTMIIESNGTTFRETLVTSRKYKDRGERVPVLEEV